MVTTVVNVIGTTRPYHLIWIVTSHWFKLAGPVVVTDTVPLGLGSLVASMRVRHWVQSPLVMTGVAGQLLFDDDTLMPLYDETFFALYSMRSIISAARFVAMLSSFASRLRVTANYCIAAIPSTPTVRTTRAIITSIIENPCCPAAQCGCRVVMPLSLRPSPAKPARHEQVGVMHHLAFPPGATVTE